MQPDPKWDRRFLEMAQLVSTWSKDPSSKIGAVIVRPDRTVASVGFNGFAQGLPDSPELYANRDFKIATVLHAEDNAIAFARDHSLAGHTLYVSGLPPCAGCASKIIRAGISRVVAFDRMVPTRWAENMLMAANNLMMAQRRIDILNEESGGLYRIIAAHGLQIECAPYLYHNMFREKIG